MPQTLRGYEYSPLTKTTPHIRLVQFLSGATLNCRIVTTELSKAPSFVALSYTWGDPTVNHAITTNLCVLPITQSLNSALEYLHSGLRNDGLLLWVDGICINQKDIAERSSQVRIMGDIYKTAKRVDVWLGPSFEESDLAFEKMKDWKEALLSPEKPEQYREWTDLASFILMDNKKFWGPPGSVEHKAWVAVYKIWERPWWRRIWIVQEVLNAKDLLVICGNKCVDWDTLTTTIFAGMILEKLSSWDISTTNHYGLTYVSRLRDLYATLRPYKRTGIGPAGLTLLGGLTRLRPQLATDPRDKVFATLGLAVGVREEHLIPDYTLTLDQINLKVVEHCIKFERHQFQLDFLGYVLRCKAESDFFSEKKLSLTFVPNWAIATNMTEFRKTLVVGPEAGDPVYRASGTWRSPARVGSLLVLDALIVEVVEHVTEVCEDIDDAGRIKRARSWKFEEDENHPYVSGGSLREAFLHTLVVDVQQDTAGARSRGYKVDEKFLGLAEENRLSLGEFAILNNSMKSAIWGRVSFSTRNMYIGIGPAGTRKGDVVCVFAGGQVLYVIRHRGDGLCEFIGECYVHGMMDGEAVKYENNGQVKGVVKLALV